MHSYSKNSTDKFTGTGVALVTPFNDDNTIDWKGLGKLIEHVIENNCDYLVSMGTTGESVTLNEEERFSIIDFTVKINKGRVPVVAGFGGNNTVEIIEQIKKYSFKGVDAILSTSPYYNRPSQEGIYQHYREIDKISPLPVILYNVPSRTSSNIEAETTLRIAQNTQHVIGIKEASGNFAQCMKIIENKTDNFLVISGDDIITLPMIACGMEGVISVIANAYSKDFSAMVKYCLNGDFEKAKPLHYKLLEITELIFKEGSPAGIKCVLKHLHICKDTLRLPLWNVSKMLDDKIAEKVKLLG